MAIKITSPTQQGVQVGGLPYSLAVTAIADSNINTDVRFKLNGAVVGIDTMATNIGTAANPQYQYGLAIRQPAKSCFWSIFLRRTQCCYS